MSSYKKQMIKSLILVIIIIGIACISTYYIYNKFHKSRSIDYSSESLDITLPKLNLVKKSFIYMNKTCRLKNNKFS